MTGSAGTIPRSNLEAQPVRLVIGLEVKDQRRKRRVCAHLHRVVGTSPEKVEVSRYAPYRSTLIRKMPEPRKLSFADNMTALRGVGRQRSRQTQDLFTTYAFRLVQMFIEVTAEVRRMAKFSSMRCPEWLFNGWVAILQTRFIVFRRSAQSATRQRCGLLDRFRNHESMLLSDRRKGG